MKKRKKKLFWTWWANPKTDLLLLLLLFISNKYNYLQNVKKEQLSAKNSVCLFVDSYEVCNGIPIMGSM